MALQVSKALKGMVALSGMLQPKPTSSLVPV